MLRIQLAGAHDLRDGVPGVVGERPREAYDEMRQPDGQQDQPRPEVRMRLKARGKGARARFARRDVPGRKNHAEQREMQADSARHGRENPGHVRGHRGEAEKAPPHVLRIEILAEQGVQREKGRRDNLQDRGRFSPLSGPRRGQPFHEEAEQENGGHRKGRGRPAHRRKGDADLLPGEAHEQKAKNQNRPEEVAPLKSFFFFHVTLKPFPDGRFPTPAHASFSACRFQCSALRS